MEGEGQRRGAGGRGRRAWICMRPGAGAGMRIRRLGGGRGNMSTPHPATTTPPPPATPPPSRNPPPRTRTNRTTSPRPPPAARTRATTAASARPAPRRRTTSTRCCSRARTGRPGHMRMGPRIIRRGSSGRKGGVRWMRLRVGVVVEEEEEGRGRGVRTDMDTGRGRGRDRGGMRRRRLLRQGARRGRISMRSRILRGRDLRRRW
ncbi:hypothetical protein C8R47DRAFT_1095605 [Mycena vitilis]|nr:hypothetical protein C8R47DRAFT_1095605 [Mycena vitilis]